MVISAHFLDSNFNFPKKNYNGVQWGTMGYNGVQENYNGVQA